MNTNKKLKHLALLLVCFLAFGLGACQGANPKPASEAGTSTPTSATESVAESATETAKEAETSKAEATSKAEETTQAEEASSEAQGEETTAADEKASETAAAAKLPDLKGRSMNVVTTSEKYKELFDAFGQLTGAKVDFLSMSSGEVIARVKAEGGKPMADLWFGGGLDAFLAAKADGLLDSYKSEALKDVRPEYYDPEGFWLSKGITVAGFIVNNDILKEKNLKMPATWEDLADPQYKDEIIMSNPAISGTNYAVVKGLLDQFGEEKGWKIIEGFNANIPFYSKRGKDPQEKTVAGEFAIGIIPADKSAFDAAKDHNCTVVYPDVVPWVPEGIAVFKDAENADVAKAFLDFMLTDENLQKLAELDGKDPGQMLKPGLKGFDLGLPVDRLAKSDLSTFGSAREGVLAHFTEMAGEKANQK